MLKSIIELLHGNAALIGLLVGAVSPLLTSVLQQPQWSKRVRIAVSGAVSIVIGFAIAAAAGQLDPGNLLGIIVAVYTAAEAFYQKLWKVTGVAGAVEAATSPTPQISDAAFEAYLLGLDDDGEPDHGPEPEGLEYK